MIQLQTISLKNMPATTEFPYNVPVMRAFESLTFKSDITFLVGENGSGKSTFLEALACAAALPTVGSEHVDNDPTLAKMRGYAKNLRLSWTKKSHRGFFMRSEDFFGFVKRVAVTRSELEEELRAVDVEYEGRSEMARNLARMPYVGELHDLERKYGVDLDANSHGESYFALFQSRFVPDGLYLLDEPEAPLSPMRQLSLLAMLKMMVDQNAQFIIATHSPILMAYPGAEILSFEDGLIRPVAYDTLEHVTITRSFLNNPGSFLRHLME